MNMKVYEVVFDENNDKGVYALSCVDNPAMEDTWLTLSEHHKEIQFSAVDDEKRLLLGAALIPNKKVYRNINGEEFYITFPEKTIEACAHSFLKNGFQNNSSENHEIELNGVSVVQSWIVENPEMDKSKAFGKTYEKGTWVTMMKVDNEEAWKKAKSGELNGFSIDGLFSLKEINLKSDSMSKKSIQEELKEFFASFNKKDEVKLGTLKLKDGKTSVEFEGEKPEVGKPIFILSGEEKIVMPEGEHETESGEVIFVDKNGLVAEEVKADDVIGEEVIAEMKSMVAELMKNHKTETDAKIQEMQKDFDAKLKVEQEKNKELEGKLEKQPAEEKIVKGELSKVEEPKTAKERLFNVALGAINNN